MRRDVRFTPKSGHFPRGRTCPLSAKSGHQSIAAEPLLASEQQARVADFVAYYSDQRYHESLDNLTPADVYFGRGQRILERRDVIKRQTLDDRRQRNLQSAA